MKLGKNFQGVDKGSAGYKLLSAMGWKEGEGLGANKQGITEHIKVKKKFDSSGVGAAEAAARARDWSLGMVQFESVLSGLKEVTSKHHKSNTNESDSSSDEEEEDSDDEEEQPQKKKQKVEPSSVKKGSTPSANGTKSTSIKSKTAAKSSSSSESESSSDSDSGSDSDSSGSDSDDERSDSDKRKPAAGKKKVASHIGRYRKRENAKMVKHYSACDLAAILGTNSATSADTVVDVPPVVATKTEVKEDMWAAAVKVEPAAAAEAPGAGLGRQEEAVKTSSISQQPIQAVPASGPSSWWSSMFIQAGGIGGQRNEPSLIKPPTKPGQADTININGFSEQDQENLYNKVQNHRSQGRGGLGISDKPKLASGSRWMGTKTRIVDSDDEEEQEDTPVTTNHAQPTLVEQHAPSNDVIVVLPPLRKQGNGAGASRTGTVVKQEVSVKQENAVDGTRSVKQEAGVKQEDAPGGTGTGAMKQEKVSVKQENAADGAKTGIKVKQEDAADGEGKAKKVKKEKGKQKDESKADLVVGDAQGQKPGAESSKTGGESSKKKRKRSEGEEAEDGTGKKQDDKSDGGGVGKVKDGSSDDLSSGEKGGKGSKKNKKKKDGDRTDGDRTEGGKEKDGGRKMGKKRSGDKTDGERTEGEKTDGERDGGRKMRKKKSGDKTDGERTEGEKTDGGKDVGRKIGKKKSEDKSEDVKAGGDRGDGAEKRSEQGKGDNDGKGDAIDNVDGISKGASGSKPSEGSEFGKVKWKSVVKKILKEQPEQRLKISKLQQAALQAAEVAQGDAELAAKAMMEEVGRLTSLFEVTAKHVVLCGAIK